MSAETPDSTAAPDAFDHLAAYPLLNALRERRSRRFARGMRIEGGPTAYTSEAEPLPLSEDEQAVLAFAACGITGPALADWSYAPGSGGNMMAGFAGRTVGSPDAIQTLSVFVIDDERTWLARRPQDLDPGEVANIARLTNEGEFVEAWRRLRVRVADGRRAAPVEPPFNLNPNRWSLHAEGTTYFLLVSEFTHLYINALLGVFNEDTRMFVVDERRQYRPAGLGRFARSKGGHLDDDPRNGRALSVGFVERLVAEMCAIEQGMALQNLGLACQALGLSGFPHYAGHDEAWFEELGFDTGVMPITRFLSVPLPAAAILRLRGQNASMTAAVRAVVDRKFGSRGVYRTRGAYRGEGGESGWRDTDAVTSEVPEISDRAIEAASAYCEYLWEHYGRFPATYPPFHTLMGFQAGHVDEGFYDHHYRPGALSDTHRDHDERWH